MPDVVIVDRIHNLLLRKRMAEAQVRPAAVGGTSQGAGDWCDFSGQ